MPTLGLDQRVALKLRGENEDQKESEIFLIQAFAVALAVMALILITQFNSFYQAFLILSAVLFSTVGVFSGVITYSASLWGCNGRPWGYFPCGHRC